MQRVHKLSIMLCQLHATWYSGSSLDALALLDIARQDGTDASPCQTATTPEVSATDRATDGHDGAANDGTNATGSGERLHQSHARYRWMLRGGATDPCCVVDSLSMWDGIA